MGLACAALIALAYLGFGARFAASFSTNPAVARTAERYIGWAVALPLAGIVSFVLDGAFVGSSWTRAMLGTMAIALAVFVATLFVARPLGDDGLWLAFTAFFVARGAGQAVMLPRLIRRSFSPRPALAA
jgi:MATE family multidrug resistance protein